MEEDSFVLTTDDENECNAQEYHNVTETTNNEITCKICNGTFSKRFYPYHKLTHGSLFSSCSKKNFDSKLNRQNNVRKKYLEINICKICSGHFSSKYILARHMKIHEKSKCIICKRDYRNIESHLKATIEKSLKCKYCNKIFCYMLEEKSHTCKGFKK